MGSTNKRRIKIKTDIRIKIFRNIIKTFKYFFKNIFYIVFLNTFFISMYAYIFEPKYFKFLSDNIQDPSVIYIFRFILPLLFLYIIKIIFYGNTIYVMKSGGVNDLKDLLSLVFRRFLPVLGTLIIFMSSVFLFLLLLIIPGIMYFFYYYFAIFLTAVGDINDKQKNELKTISGLKTLGRSYKLLKNNLMRFSFLTITMVIIAVAIEKFAIAILINLGFGIDNTFAWILKFCIFDIIIIYSALMFMKFEGIENDVLEERFKGNQEEEVMLRSAMVNKFGKSKK